MDICSFCLQPGNLFTTGDSTTFACAKCQPYVQDTNAGSDHDNSELNPSTDRQVTVHDGKLYVNQMSGEDCMFHCDLCNKSFDKNLKFQNHMRNHRAERKYVCPHCTKGFSQSNNLRAHLRIHTNERPYKCVECGKAFTQVTNLNNHIRLHTGEKPFACTEPGCDKAFAQVTNLNNHRKSHLREQRHFSCEMCGQVFPHRSQLSAHTVSAHGGWAGPGYGSGPMLACEACGEAFASSADLTRHVHNECRERGDAVPLPFKRMANVTVKRQINNKGQDPKKKQSPTGNQVKCLFGDCKELFANMEEFHRHLIVQHSLTINSHKTKPKKSIDYSDEIIEIEDDEPTSETKSASQSRCSDISKVAGKTKAGSTTHPMKQERPDSSSDSDTDTSGDDDEDSDSRESDRRKSVPRNVPAPTPIQKDVKLVCNLCFATFDSLLTLESHVEDEH